MLRKSALLALAASAALGLAMLSTGSASALSIKGGHGGHGGHGIHGGHHGHHGHHRRPHWQRHYVRWHRPIWYRPVVYAARPVVPGPCTCLSKEYTQEGAVLFKDRCTNEMAMNPPAVAPQQTGMVEPQQQTAQYQAQYVQPQPTYPPQTK